MENLSVPIEYEDSVCEIKTMDNELIATGTISKISEKYIILKSKQKNLPFVDYGDYIKINVFNTKEGFRVIVGNVYTSTSSELSIVNMVSLVDHERRNFFRVDLEMSVNIKVIPPESKESRNIDVIIKDMSLSGMRFRSKEYIAEGTIITVRLALSKNKTFPLEYKVVRIINEDAYNNIQYGCMLTSDDNERTDSLCAFLFQKQREFLNRKR